MTPADENARAVLRDVVDIVDHIGGILDAAAEAERRRQCDAIRRILTIDFTDNDPD